MKQALSNITFLMGGFVGLLTVLDWLLSKNTKLKIKSKTENAWYYLDEWSKIDLTSYFYKRNVLILIIIFFNIFFIYALSTSNIGDGGTFLGQFFLSSIIIVLILPRILKWMTPVSKYDFYFFCYVLGYFIELVFGGNQYSLGAGFSYPFIITSHAFIILGFLWLITIFSLKVLLKTLDLLALRVVEHDKGPIIGLSILLIGTGALLKTFL